MQQYEEIAAYLKDLPYPVSKGEVKHAAKKHGAPKDIVKMFHKLPFQSFRNEAEIMTFLGFAGYQAADEHLQGQEHRVA